MVFFLIIFLLLENCSLSSYILSRETTSSLPANWKQHQELKAVDLLLLKACDCRDRGFESKRCWFRQQPAVP